VWGFALAAVLVTQFVPVASRAAASGSIAGSVESGGSAVRDICVDVFSASGTLVLQTVTDANGMYAANDLPAGPYKVHFDDCVGPDDYAPEWNGGGRDQNLAPVVTVTVGVTAQVNADLDPWGAITGTVEDTGGSAIRDICVRAFDQLGQGVGWSRTDANGMFTLKIRSLLGTGSYKVRFKDCVAPFEFVPEWNDDRRLPRRVPWVSVTLGDDTEVNAALQRWGAIAGTVTDEITSMPLPDICVRVFRRFPRHAPKGIGWARTDAAGTYQVIIRKTWIGAYKVRFSDCIHPRGYVTEFYDNTFDRWLPTFVIVNRGVITAGIDAALSRGGGGGGGGGGAGSLPRPPPMAVASFAPSGGPVGTRVSIDGSGFTGATGVSFNDVPSLFTVDSDTHITASVPPGASAGVISVSTPSGTTRSVATFAVGHGRAVTLWFGRSLWASGTVRVSDGFERCREETSVAIQRYRSGGWHLVKKGLTDLHGYYRIRLHDLAGRYRASLKSVVLESGDICEASASRPRPN